MTSLTRFLPLQMLPDTTGHPLSGLCDPEPGDEGEDARAHAADAADVTDLQIAYRNLHVRLQKTCHISLCQSTYLQHPVVPTPHQRAAIPNPVTSNPSSLQRYTNQYPVRASPSSTIQWYPYHTRGLHPRHPGSAILGPS